MGEEDVVALLGLYVGNTGEWARELAKALLPDFERSRKKVKTV